MRSYLSNKSIIQNQSKRQLFALLQSINILEIKFSYNENGKTYEHFIISQVKNKSDVNVGCRNESY